MARLGLQTVTAFVLAATAFGFVPPAPRSFATRGRAMQMKQHTDDFWIAPSILSADFAKLGQEVRFFWGGGCWDVMCGLIVLWVVVIGLLGVGGGLGWGGVD